MNCLGSTSDLRAYGNSGQTSTQSVTALSDQRLFAYSPRKTTQVELAFATCFPS